MNTHPANPSSIAAIAAPGVIAAPWVSVASLTINKLAKAKKAL